MGSFLPLHRPSSTFFERWWRGGGKDVTRQAQKRRCHLEKTTNCVTKHRTAADLLRKLKLRLLTTENLLESSRFFQSKSAVQ